MKRGIWYISKFLLDSFMYVRYILMIYFVVFWEEGDDGVFVEDLYLELVDYDDLGYFLDSFVIG